MIGFLATVCVICQMALLSFGFSSKAAMTVGLLGCCLWILHSLKHKDKWLLTTNAAVAIFALYGLS